MSVTKKFAGFLYVVNWVPWKQTLRPVVTCRKFIKDFIQETQL